jgi:multiple sugar transport system substrate-binding protein
MPARTRSPAAAPRSVTGLFHVGNPRRSDSRAAVTLLALACLAGSVVAGCSGGGGADQRVVLRLTTWAGQEEMAIMEETIALFEQRYPEVDVRHETIPVNYKEKVMISVAGGAPPDVILIDSEDLPAFVKRSLLINLAPYGRRVGLDLDLFYPQVLEIGRRGEALYAWPKDFTPMVIYYNADLLERAGVRPAGVDWTWEEFLAAARACTADEDGDGEPETYGVNIGRQFFYWQPWVWSAGGQSLSPDGTRAGGWLDAPQARAAIGFLADLHGRWRVSPRPEVFRGAGGMVQNLFYVGRLAMMESGHWILPKLGRYVQEGRVRIGVANIPHREGTAPVTVMYESGWAVPAAGRHRQWAVRLAAFLADEEAQRIRGRLGLAVPAMPHLAAEIVAADPWGLGDAFLRIIPTSRPSRGTEVDDYRVVDRLLAEVFDRIHSRGETVEEATTAVARRVDEVLGTAPGRGPGSPAP